jgi:hypothetical protein
LLLITLPHLLAYVHLPKVLEEAQHCHVQPITLENVLFVKCQILLITLPHLLAYVHFSEVLEEAQHCHVQPLPRILLVALLVHACRAQ